MMQHDKLPKQKVLTTLRRPVAFLALAALLVFMVIAVWNGNQRNALVSETVVIDGMRVRIDVFQQQGRVYALAQELRGSGDGWSTTRLLFGPVKEVSPSEVDVSTDEDEKIISVALRKRSFELNLRSTHRFIEKRAR
jgi:hypothetical protein